jgi:hypothetical protein
MGGDERKNKGGEHQELQDLDLLSLFPQEDARIMGGMGR